MQLPHAREGKQEKTSQRLWRDRARQLSYVLTSGELTEKNCSEHVRTMDDVKVFGLRSTEYGPGANWRLPFGGVFQPFGDGKRRENGVELSEARKSWLAEIQNRTTVTIQNMVLQFWLTDQKSK